MFGVYSLWNVVIEFISERISFKDSIREQLRAVIPYLFIFAVCTSLIHFGLKHHHFLKYQGIASAIIFAILYLAINFLMKNHAIAFLIKNIKEIFNTKVIVKDQSYNQHVDLPRLVNWAEFKSLL